MISKQGCILINQITSLNFQFSCRKVKSIYRVNQCSSAVFLSFFFWSLFKTSKPLWVISPRSTLDVCGVQCEEQVQLAKPRHSYPFQRFPPVSVNNTGKAAVPLPTKPNVNWNSCISPNLAFPEVSGSFAMNSEENWIWPFLLGLTSISVCHTSVDKRFCRESLSSVQNSPILFNHSDHHRKRWPEIQVLFLKPEGFGGRASIVKSSLDKNTFVAFFRVLQKDKAIANVFSIPCAERLSQSILLGRGTKKVLLT